MPLHGDLLTRLRNATAARFKEVAVPYTQANLSILSVLLQQGFIHSVHKGTVASPSDPAAFREASLPSRRLWVQLKYNALDRPVLSHLDLISRPSKKVFMDRDDLIRFCTYRRSQYVRPLTMGEVAIVDCGKKGWYEAREAIKNGIDKAEVVARAG